MSEFNFKDYSNDNLRSAVFSAYLAGGHSAEEVKWIDALLEEYGNRTSPERAKQLQDGALFRCTSWN